MAEAITIQFGEQDAEYGEEDINILADMFQTPGWAIYRQLLTNQLPVNASILDNVNLSDSDMPTVFKAVGERGLIREQLSWEETVAESIKIMREQKNP